MNCGIPDFRSKDSGLYNTLDCESIGIPSAELLFDYQYFAIDPEPFYRFARWLLPRDNIVPSYCHQFIATLERRKKLLRNYTQNVDGIEQKAKISKNKIVECHGSIHTFRCMDCNNKKKLTDKVVMDSVLEGSVPYCSASGRCEGVMKVSSRQKRESSTNLFL